MGWDDEKEWNGIDRFFLYLGKDLTDIRHERSA
jgi:hypothetical protein